MHDTSRLMTPHGIPVSPITVLLIEDNQGFAYGVRDMLTRQSREAFEIAGADTLAGGLAVLMARAVDVVLLDLGLPDSARIETFSRVHAVAPNTPIVVLTVLDDDEVAIAAMRAGAQDYLVKERVQLDLLVRSIKYAIERTRNERALHELSGRLIRVQDEERRRIARDLHDMTAQNLAAVSLHLAALQARAPAMSAELRTLMADSQACLSRCSADLRTAIYLLHPPLLDELGLAGAVRDYADGFAARSGIRVDLELPPQLERLPHDVERALFRIMQEGLSNIHRHAASPTASLRFALADGAITLDVRDAGRGLPAGLAAAAAASTGATGVGLAGMRERVRQLRGSMQLTSDAAGTCLRVTLPIAGACP